MSVKDIISWSQKGGGGAHVRGAAYIRRNTVRYSSKVF